ncbi:hypothetical protein BH23ACT9_BH23ACT9_04160 [soil metagenome]
MPAEADNRIQTGTVTVGVPHDKRDTPIDSGDTYDSTG